MAFAVHRRVQMSGVVTDSTGVEIEIFSTGVNMSAPGGPLGARYDQAAADDVAADCVAFWARPETQIGQAAILRTVKYVEIGADGKYATDPFIVEVNQAGGGSIPRIYFPLQVSLALSLQSARRGPTGKGRMYLPVPATSIDGNGVIALASRDAVATSFQTFLNDLNNWPNADVADPKVTIASSKGYNSDVTSVKVGRVLDTIRTRRNDLFEQYSADLPVN